MSITNLSPDQRKQLIDEYIAGSKIKDVAVKFGAGYQATWRFLKRNHVQIRPDHFLSNRRYLFDIHAFDTIDTEEKAYWLGFLYADGCNYEPRYTVSLSLAEEDAAHVQRFADFLSLNRPMRYTAERTPQSQRQACIVATDMHFSKRLHDLGMVSNKTLILRFPTQNQVPTHLLRHFIRGYFDGDGSITKLKYRKGRDSHRPTYGASIVSTESFCQAVATIIHQHLAISCYTSTRFPERNNSTRQISFGGNSQTERFLDWLYQDAHEYLPRKYQRYLELKYVNSISDKRIQQITLSGEVIAEFPSAIDAAKAIGGQACSIRGICNGKAARYKDGVMICRKTTYMQFGWRYVDQKPWSQLLHERTL